MASNRRERQLAREHYARQQQRRAQSAHKRRRWQQTVAVVLAVALVIFGLIGTAWLLDDDNDTSTATPPAASPSASTTPSATKAAKICPAPTVQAPATPQTFPSEPPLTVDQKTTYVATLKTNCGDIEMNLFADKAPHTVNSFAFLAGKKYFDGSPCHRVTTTGLFVLQCGDPTGTGSGTPGYAFGVENAPPDGKYPAGTVAMARTSDPNSNGSQFFIVYDDTTLPTDTGGYSIFGEVTKGLDIVKKVAEQGVSGGGTDGKPAQPISIESVSVRKA